jgi:predicted nucleic acid-binding protein
MVFVDTNVLVAALNEKDSDHRRGKVLLESAFQKFECLYISD